MCEKLWRLVRIGWSLQYPLLFSVLKGSTDTALGVDSFSFQPFFSAIVLFKNRSPFPQVFVCGFLERRIPGKNGEVTLEYCQPRFTPPLVILGGSLEQAGKRFTCDAGNRPNRGTPVSSTSMPRERRVSEHLLIYYAQWCMQTVHMPRSTL